MFAVAISCFAQIAPTTVSLSNGVQLVISTKLGAPAGSATIHVEMVRASGNSFYRIFRDQNQLAVFGYELRVALAGSGDRLIATAIPAETRFAARFPNADAGKPVPTLSSEHRLNISSGRSAEIGLFELEGQGLRVIDTVQMRLTLGASAGKMRLDGLRPDGVGINPLWRPAPSSVAGRFAMLYIPNRGAFFLSTEMVPDRPFVKAGLIDHNRMSFSIENTQFNLIADAPILSDPPTGELWVYHDPSYRPEGNWTQDLRKGTPSKAAADEFFMAASDSLSWWLPE